MAETNRLRYLHGGIRRWVPRNHPQCDTGFEKFEVNVFPIIFQLVNSYNFWNSALLLELREFSAEQVVQSFIQMVRVHKNYFPSLVSTLLNFMLKGSVVGFMSGLCINLWTHFSLGGMECGTILYSIYIYINRERERDFHIIEAC